VISEQMNSNKLRSLVVSSNEEFDSILPAWESFLAHQAEGQTFWQDPNEIRLLVEYGDWDAMKVVLLWQGNEIVCVAPCIIRPQPFDFRCSVLRFPGPRLRVLKLLDSNFIFSEGVDSKECTRIMLEIFRKIKSEFDVVCLENLEESSSIYQMYKDKRSVERVKIQFVTLTAQKSYRHILAPSYDDWIKSIRRKKRNQLRRCVRVLKKNFSDQIKFIRISESADVKGFLNSINQIFPKTWQAKTFGNRQRNCEKDIIKFTYIAEKGWLRGYLLFVKGNPVCFVLGYQYAGVFEYSEIGYDLDFSKWSVGNVLNFLMIEDIYNWRKPEVINFGYGDNYYKRLFGNDESNVHRAYLSCSLLGWWSVRGQVLLNTFEIKIKNFFVKIGIDRFLRKKLKRKM